MSKPTTSDMTVSEILTNLVNCAKHEDDVLQQFKPECITKQQALAAIEAHYAAKERADMEYVIGKDELADMVNYNEGWREDDTVVAQNDLRAEQRQRMAERLNNTEEV